MIIEHKPDTAKNTVAGQPQQPMATAQAAIGAEQVKQFMQILQEYKAGKVVHQLSLQRSSGQTRHTLSTMLAIHSFMPSIKSFILRVKMIYKQH